MTPKRLPTSSLPMKPAVYHVLASLSEGDKHGYAVKRHIKLGSDGKLDLDPGTLYRLIARLLEDGLVTEVEGPEKDDANARRRYYRLTHNGRTAFIAETERMARLVDAARGSGIIGSPRAAR